MKRGSSSPTVRESIIVFCPTALGVIGLATSLTDSDSAMMLWATSLNSISEKAFNVLFFAASRGVQMKDLPDVPLSHSAEQLMNRLRPRIQGRLEEVGHVPVSVLIWGPGVNAESRLAEVRVRLRSKLRANGHAAAFSEELCDPKSAYSLRLQQIAQAQEFDLVVSLPCTTGSIGEIHDFVADRRVSAKILVFLNGELVAGYSSQSIQAISTIVSCQIEYYPNEDDTDVIEEVTVREVQKIREMKYILAGRY
jgi:hypothetical protein